MKILGYILSVYMLGLSFITCCDGQESVVGDGPVFTSAQSQSGHGHQNDICSPFCTCVCCVNLSHPENIEIKIGFTMTANQKYFDVEEKPVTFTYNIWQPPKIAV